MTMTPNATPTLPMPTKDVQFLNGINLDSPADIGRSIAMQIRVRGHYQGARNAHIGSACVVASAAYGSASLDQRREFDAALANRLGEDFRDAGYSLIWWNDHTPTEDVLATLESIPSAAGGGCDH